MVEILTKKLWTDSSKYGQSSTKIKNLKKPLNCILDTMVQYMKKIITPYYPFNALDELRMRRTKSKLSTMSDDFKWAVS